jgi:predicted lipoprotein with Yx(FWY)xxD motif
MSDTRSGRAGLRRVALYCAGATLAMLPGIGIAQASASTTTVVQTHKTPAEVLGSAPAVVLATSNGHTLYMFNHDGFNKSHCSGSCAKTWKPLIAHGKLSAKSGVKSKLLGTIKRSDGQRQVVYKKYPLYTYVKDKKAGDSKGWSNHSFGGHWWTLNTKGYAIELFNGFVFPCASPLSAGGYGC